MAATVGSLRPGDRWQNRSGTISDVVVRLGSTGPPHFLTKVIGERWELATWFRAPVTQTDEGVWVL